MKKTVVALAACVLLSGFAFAQKPAHNVSAVPRTNHPVSLTTVKILFAVKSKLPRSRHVLRALPLQSYERCVCWKRVSIGRVERTIS